MLANDHSYAGLRGSMAYAGELAACSEEPRGDEPRDGEGWPPSVFTGAHGPFWFTPWLW